MAKQELLPQAILDRLPALYSQEHNPDPIVQVKYFTPDSDWTWYATEGSPVDADGYYDTDKPKVGFIFFGLVQGFEEELGYFTLAELKEGLGPMGLHIERDEHFTPKPLSEARKG